MGDMVINPVLDDIGRALIVDVETTGLNPSKDEIVELAWILFTFCRTTGEILGIIDTYSGLREPTTPIPSPATAIHGITNAMVQGQTLDGPRIAWAFNQAECVIAHSAAFDQAFITRLDPSLPHKVWGCSLRQIPWTHYGYPSRRLHNLLQEHGLSDLGRAHRALNDCFALITLLRQRNGNGDYHLATLLQHMASKSSRTTLP